MRIIMKKRTSIILNLIFILITIISLVISFLFQFFFFIPIICFLPWTCTFLRHRDQEEEQKEFFITEYSAPDYCPECGERIKQKNAIHCYHCGAKLSGTNNTN